MIPLRSPRSRRVATLRIIAVGIAAIGSILFGGLVITGPDTVASGFLDAAAPAMLVSALMAIAAFALVFVLPKSVSRRG